MRSRIHKTIWKSYNLFCLNLAGEEFSLTGTIILNNFQHTEFCEGMWLGKYLAKLYIIDNKFTLQKKY